MTQSNEPIKEADVPKENPQTINIGPYPGTHHQIIDEDDGRIETACGRVFAPEDADSRGAWVDTDYWFACDECAQATGLSDLDPETVLEFLRAKIGQTVFVEVETPADELPGTDLPMLEVSPRDGVSRVPGGVNDYMRHLNYSFAGATTDHRDEPLLSYSPQFSLEVTVEWMEESDE